jgi:hypothetical protein
MDLGGAYEEAEDLLPEIELPPSASEAETADFRPWNRKPPLPGSRNAILVETDPAALERANGQHFLLEQRISELCNERGLRPRTNVHIDLVVETTDTSVIFEMKSSSLSAIRSQLRRAVSQLLEYRYIYRNHLKARVLLCAVLERKPRGRVSWVLGYLEDLGIGLIWKNDRNSQLNCTEATKKVLSNILPQVTNTDF